MASEREIGAAAAALVKLLGLSEGAANEAARTALEAAERARRTEPDSEPETGDIIG